MRRYEGPALFSYGFRPFFLGAGVWSAAPVAVWTLAATGYVSLPFAARDWHVHEMLFGYLAAAIAGFLLTAVPNWTGRLPVTGSRLMVLVRLVARRPDPSLCERAALAGVAMLVALIGGRITPSFTRNWLGD